MIHVPGDCSANPVTARGVPGLFARNERVVCIFDGEFGSFVLVLVGADDRRQHPPMVWHGTVNPPRSGVVREWSYDTRSRSRLWEGEEMGRFLLGSTVVVRLFPRTSCASIPTGRRHARCAWARGMGERIGPRV